jgi:hypothetical protein
MDTSYWHQQQQLLDSGYKTLGDTKINEMDLSAHRISFLQFINLMKYISKFIKKLRIVINPAETQFDCTFIANCTHLEQLIILLPETCLDIAVQQITNEFIENVKSSIPTLQWWTLWDTNGDRPVTYTFKGEEQPFRIALSYVNQE